MWTRAIWLAFVLALPSCAPAAPAPFSTGLREAATPAPPSGPTLPPAGQASGPPETRTMAAATATLLPVTIASSPPTTPTALPMVPANYKTAPAASELAAVTPSSTSEPTAPATATYPTTTPAATQTRAPLTLAPATTYETTVTIPTYGYQAGFVATLPEDPVYPYPQLDFSRIGPPAPVTYRAIVLENSFVRLMVLPELGGRLYSWQDRTTGRELLYQNPVIKPTGWGYRGWWLAAGGVEWVFPVEEHGLIEWQPWQAAAHATETGVAVTVSNVEMRTGMTAGVTISLDTARATVSIQPWVRNDTAVAQEYQLWLNAMLALAGNRVSLETRIILPANQVIIHSSGDGQVPQPGATMAWPVYQNRDMRRYGNWQGWLGFFAPDLSAPYTAVYDPVADQGIVRTFTRGMPAGTKIFGPATLSPSYWTDDASNYLELWSGATATFWQTSLLQPGQSAGWTEQWYAVHGMGQLTYANGAAALRLEETGAGAALAVASSAPVEGQLILYAGGTESQRWALSVTPRSPFQASWVRPPDSAGNLGLRLIDGSGEVVIESGEVP